MRTDSRRYWVAGGGVLLFCCVGAGLLLFASSVAMGPSARTLASSEVLGMEVYCARDPFAVFVHPDKPPSDGFLFEAFDAQFSVTESPEDESDYGAGARDVQLTLGESFSIACVFRPALAGDVRELKLMLSDYGLIDFNVDGQWDIRIWYPPKTRVEVLLQGEWRGVTLKDGTQNRRRLLSGGMVVFDREGGEWLAGPETSPDD